MIYMKIKRKCGHSEQIGIAGFSGSLHDIDAEFQTTVYNNIQLQKDKFCLPCFKKLPHETKQKLLKEAISNG